MNTGKYFVYRVSNTLLLGLLDFSGYLSTPAKNGMLRCILRRTLLIRRLDTLFIVSLFRRVYRRIRYCSTIHDACTTMDAVLFTAHAVRYYIRRDHFEKSNFKNFDATLSNTMMKIKTRFVKYQYLKPLFFSRLMV